MCPRMTFLHPASMDVIARGGGVAIRTVPRALRRDRRICAATRGRASEVARRLGGRPNPMVATPVMQVRSARPAISQCSLAWLDCPTVSFCSSHPMSASFCSNASVHVENTRCTLSKLPADAGKITAARVAQILHSRGVRSVLLATGHRAPEPVGFARLNLASDDCATSGVGQNNEAVGAAAADFLTAQLMRNEIGVPVVAKGILIPGTWRDGSTLRPTGLLSKKTQHAA